MENAKNHNAERSLPETVVKRLYIQPKLTEYGSVQELTRGNSQGNSGDKEGAKRFT